MTPLRFVLIVAAVIVGLAVAHSALAQQVPCIPRADMGSGLKERYGEHLTARFLTDDSDALVEVFTAPGTWTIVVTNASGQSCMIATGQAWVIQGVPQGEEG